jgi:tetratricopeptide (TPR) repeat protein
VRDLALAGCYEVMGRLEDAHQHYQLALKSHREDANVLQRASAFYLRMDKPLQAEKLLIGLLDPGLPAEEARRWARRQLALLLAFRGEPEAYRQALALLDANRKEGEDNLAQRRIRALVRGTQPENRHAALAELEGLLKLARPTPLEQYRLIQLYEADGNKEAAQKQMLDLLTQGDPANPAYLAHHVRTLLQNGEKSDAQTWLSELARVEPDSKRVKEFRKELEEEK